MAVLKSARETIPDLDEEGPLLMFKNLSVTISKEGVISGDDVTFFCHLGFTGIIYKYKKAANRAFKNRARNRKKLTHQL